MAEHRGFRGVPEANDKEWVCSLEGDKVRFVAREPGRIDLFARRESLEFSGGVEALVENVHVCLLLVDWRVCEGRGIATLAATVGCCDAEVSIVFVHGELVQNVSGYCACSLVVDCEAVDADTVNYCLLALAPHWLCEVDVVQRNVDRASRSDQIDLRSRMGVVLCRIKPEDRGEAVPLVDDVRVIDLYRHSFYRLTIDDLLREQDLAVAENRLCCDNIDVISDKTSTG